jgi:hypothetical protein
VRLGVEIEIAVIICTGNIAQKRSVTKVCIKRARLQFDKDAAHFIALGLPREALPFLADVS